MVPQPITPVWAVAAGGARKTARTENAAARGDELVRIVANMSTPFAVAAGGITGDMAGARTFYKCASTCVEESGAVSRACFWWVCPVLPRASGSGYRPTTAVAASDITRPEGLPAAGSNTT